MGLTNDSEIEINTLIDDVVNRYLTKAIKKPQANSSNPFIMALLKDFEPLIHRIHGFKGSLGSQLEKIAEIIAKNSWGKDNVQRNINIDLSLPQNVFQVIDSIINNLSNAKTLSDYEREKQLIIKACEEPSKYHEKHTYEFDIQIKDIQSNHTYFLEMKGPDPNTTEVSGAKKRLLVALGWGYFKKISEKIDARFAIYYNNKYPNAYKNSKVHYYFNPDGGTLVQEDFWNFLGKNESTYSDLMNLFEDYGKVNKKRIWDGFSKLIDIK